MAESAGVPVGAVKDEPSPTAANAERADEAQPGEQPAPPARAKVKQKTPKQKSVLEDVFSSGFSSVLRRDDLAPA